jgi:hypothetical protein
VTHYAGLDVSDKDTAIHVVADQGKLVWRGKRASEPEVLAAALRRHVPKLVRVGLETGQLAPWLYHSLRDLGFPRLAPSSNVVTNRDAAAPARRPPGRLPLSRSACMSLASPAITAGSTGASGASRIGL